MADSTPDLKSRIDEVEVTLSHQDQTLQDLSEVLHRQWTQIEKLEAELARLHAKLDLLEDTQSEDNESKGLSYEKPPHY
ncbi:MAG: SlyX protein [Kordiimonas sp.]|nr:SlyX protein [Kordiimonas sp.]|tara:strand:+ start:477 stop:713 length:237 start_codon:yes stop_codon:yes gene_type:complete